MSGIFSSFSFRLTDTDPAELIDSARLVSYRVDYSVKRGSQGALTCIETIDFANGTSVTSVDGGMPVTVLSDRESSSGFASGIWISARLPASGRYPLTATLDCGRHGKATATIMLRVYVPGFFADSDHFGAELVPSGFVTAKPRVRLLLHYRGYQFRARISNSPDMSDGRNATLSYAGTQWTLDPPPGTDRATVYSQFQDVDGTWGSVYATRFTIDTVKPQITSISHIEESRKQTSVRMEASDRFGVVEAEFSSTKESRNSVVADFRRRMTVRTPAGGVNWVRVLDGAGNWSAWVAFERL